MSTVFDVTSVIINADTALTASVDAIDTATITDAMEPVTVSIDATEVVSQVAVQVPGLQGPPGLKNVYVSPASEDPSKDSNGVTIWGLAEKDYIWIKT
jgi:hypothetical protein